MSLIKSFLFTLSALLLPSLGSAANREAQLLVSFDGTDQDVRWQALTDQVRGGKSEIALEVSEEQTGIISGWLTLIDGAGFASIRAIRQNPGSWDLSRAQNITLVVRGDGRSYRVLLKDRASVNSGVSVSFEATFETSAQWTLVKLPLNTFRAIRRGRPDPSAKPLSLSSVAMVGLQLNDKNEGAFRVEVRDISAQ